MSCSVGVSCSQFYHCHVFCVLILFDTAADDMYSFLYVVVLGRGDVMSFSGE